MKSKVPSSNDFEGPNFFGLAGAFSGAAASVAALAVGTTGFAALVFLPLPLVGFCAGVAAVLSAAEAVWSCFDLHAAIQARASPTLGGISLLAATRTVHLLLRHTASPVDVRPVLVANDIACTISHRKG